MVLDRSMRWPVAPHPDPHSSHKTPSRVGIFALSRCGEGGAWVSVHALCERGERRIDASHMRINERVAVCVIHGRVDEAGQGAKGAWRPNK